METVIKPLEQLKKGDGVYYRQTEWYVSEREIYKESEIRSIPTNILKKSLKESYRPELICRSGTNDWRKPEDFDEFKEVVKKKKCMTCG